MEAAEHARLYLNQKYNSRKYLLDTELAKTVTGEEFVLNYLALHSSPIFPKELSESIEIKHM